MVPAGSSSSRSARRGLWIRTVTTVALTVALAACNATGSASPSAPVSSASPSPNPAPSSTASGTPSTPSTGPSASPTEDPNATQAPAPSLGLPFACTKLPYRRPNDVLSVRIADVRHSGRALYDRLVYEFRAGKLPEIEISSVEPPFKLDPSDQPVTVEGSAFIKIRLNHVAVETIPADADDVKTGYETLVALRQTTGYEGDAVWIAGLSGPACVRVSIFSSPARLVLDFAPAG